MELIVVILYCTSLLLIFLFSLGQLNLAFHYLRGQKKAVKSSAKKSDKTSEVPYVTVQLPVYNELYVVERLLEAVAAFNYPKRQIRNSSPR